MKQKDLQAGFTFVEMLVVITIMATFTSLFLVNYVGLRGPRNLKIAQNEMVTNLRKIQSYTLSARDVDSANSARYYIMRFLHTNGGYDVQAIGANKTTSVETYFAGSSAIENIKLPQGIIISGLKVINKSGIAVMDTNAVNATAPPQCVQVGFASPFAKAYIEYNALGNCNFSTAVDNLDVIANHSLEITLRDTGSGKTSTVSLRGVTGIVEIK